MQWDVLLDVCSVLCVVCCVQCDVLLDVCSVCSVVSVFE